MMACHLAALPVMQTHADVSLAVGKTRQLKSRIQRQLENLVFKSFMLRAVHHLCAHMLYCITTGCIMKSTGGAKQLQLFSLLVDKMQLESSPALYKSYSYHIGMLGCFTYFLFVLL